MKRTIAVLLALLMMLTLLTTGVSAEGTAFNEEERVQNGHTVGLTLQLPENAVLTAVTVGGKACSLAAEGGKVYSISIDALAAGRYTDIVYQYTVDGVPQTQTMSGSEIVMEGETDVILSLSFTEAGNMTVKAFQANGLVAPAYQVQVLLGEMAENGTTDAMGEFTTVATANIGDTVTVSGVQTAYGTTGLIYKAAAPQTFTREAEETTTTITGATTAANQTYFGAGTTKLENNLVRLNASTDAAVLDQFGMTQTEFLVRSSLSMTPDHYKAIMGTTTDSLMLAAMTSENEIAVSKIRVAIGKLSEFSVYEEEGRQTYYFDLRLLRRTKGGQTVRVKELPEGAKYTVELPIPKNMTEAVAWAVAEVDDNGEIVNPRMIESANGVMTFEIDKFGGYALIGFAKEEVQQAGGAGTLLIWIFVVGVVLIAVAALLFWLFVFRKVKR